MSEIDRSQITVLVADDEPENAEAFTRVLRGYRVLAASRGDAALAIVAEHRIDIVLADQCMPGTSGALLLERARAANPLVRRVIISASVQPHHLLEAINRGEVERYLLKPVDPVALRQIIDRLADEYLAARRDRERISDLQDQVLALRRRMAVAPAPPDSWERLELEVVRARRYRRSLALIVIHQAADEAERFRAELREVDLVATLGHRLVLALPETDRRTAAVVLSRLGPMLSAHRHSLTTYPEDGADLATLLASAKAIEALPPEGESG